jgi:hypothetical protein
VSNREIDVTAAPYYARGDGKTDCTAALQKALTDAGAKGIARVIIPRGVYLCTKMLNVRGSDLSVVGDDGATLYINHHYSGTPGLTGIGLSAMPDFGSAYYPIAPVTADQVVFSGPVPFQPGEWLMLCNGIGSTALLEAQWGGVLPPANFGGYSPCEYVQVKTLAQSGLDWLVTLMEPVIGADEYGNIANSGAPALSSLHVRRIATPCSKIHLANIDFAFADSGANMSLQFGYVRDLHVEGVRVLAPYPTVTGGNGSIEGFGNHHAIFERIYSPIRILLNSARMCTIRDCALEGASLEETSTDNRIINNSFRCRDKIAVRLGDMPCRRNLIQGNTVLGAVADQGGIGIYEGIDNIISGNVVRGGVFPSIWLGDRTRGNLVSGNIADAYLDYAKVNTDLGNSWNVVKLAPAA